jgi:hypothetical protein
MDRGLGERGCLVNPAWQALADECARWHASGRAVEFWWRDDDAAQPVPALRRLLELASATRVPLALAVIPEAAEPALCDVLGDAVSVLQHGADHVNRAGEGERKTEFPDAEPVEAALARLSRGRARLRALAGDRTTGVLVPPWNRLTGRLIPHLHGAGYSGLSRYGARRAIEAAPGLRQVNTHVDLIAWHTGRAFVGEEAALALAVRHLHARRLGDAEPTEATGWLTHHACHDEAAWRFLDELFDVTRRWAGVRWVGPRELFTDGSAA